MSWSHCPSGAQMDSMFKHETELLDTGWTPQSPALASVPSVVSDATPDISESQANKVRQAVAWEALSENTRAAYQKWIARLEAIGVAVESLTDESLAVVIGQMEDKAGKPLSPATLSLTVASVKWYHRHILRGATDWTTTDKRLLSIKRDSVNRGAGQVDGLAWADVDVITRLSALDGTARGLRDAVLVRLMSDCLLRISEAVAVNVEDLSDSTLIVHRSKTDQTGEGAVLFVGKETIDLIRRYQAVSEVSSGALFRRIRRGDTVTAHRLTLNGARQAIKDAAELVGIPSDRVSGHSLRVGSAVSLGSKRVPRSSRCKVLDDGSRLRCQRIMHGCRRQSRGLWLGSGMARVGNDDLQNTQSHGRENAKRNHIYNETATRSDLSLVRITSPGNSPSTLLSAFDTQPLSER